MSRFHRWMDYLLLYDLFLHITTHFLRFHAVLVYLIPLVSTTKCNAHLYNNYKKMRKFKWGQMEGEGEKELMQIQVTEPQAPVYICAVWIPFVRLPIGARMQEWRFGHLECASISILRNRLRLYFPIPDPVRIYFRLRLLLHCLASLPQLPCVLFALATIVWGNRRCDCIMRTVSCCWIRQVLMSSSKFNCVQSMNAQQRIRDI